MLIELGSLVKMHLMLKKLRSSRRWQHHSLTPLLLQVSVCNPDSRCHPIRSTTSLCERATMSTENQYANMQIITNAGAHHRKDDAHAARGSNATPERKSAISRVNEEPEAATPRGGSSKGNRPTGKKMGKKAAKPAFPAPSQTMVQQGFQLLDPTNSGFVNPLALSDVSCPCTVTPLLHISALDSYPCRNCCIVTPHPQHAAEQV